MHTDLFGEQPCCMRDNNILYGEYIRDDTQASGHIHKTNPFRVIMTGCLCICTRVYVLLSVSYVSVWVCVCECFCLRASRPIENDRPYELDSGHYISSSQHAAAVKRRSRALPTTSFGDQQTGHIKAGDKKEQRHESSASLSLLCSVEQNLITEGNHPKPMMLQSFRKGTRYMRDISREKDGRKEMTTGWLCLCL